MNNQSAMMWSMPLRRAVRSPLKLGLFGKRRKKEEEDSDKDDDSTESDDEDESDETSKSSTDYKRMQNKDTKVFDCNNCKDDECRTFCNKQSPKQIKMIRGGQSNSINQNSGPTFIVNNNYYGFVNGKLTKLKSPPKGINITIIDCSQCL